MRIDSESFWLAMLINATTMIRLPGPVYDYGKLVVALSMLGISSGNCLERRKVGWIKNEKWPVSGNLSAKRMRNHNPKPKPYGLRW
ncbi:MAG TPA: hypothetical protein VLM42_17665 [Bryobacteraceae bacterium]|nr:hypothetical protein [Bryobacteraceae bacterium]